MKEKEESDGVNFTSLSDMPRTSLKNNCGRSVRLDIEHQSEIASDY